MVNTFQIVNLYIQKINLKRFIFLFRHALGFTIEPPNDSTQTIFIDGIKNSSPFSIISNLYYYFSPHNNFYILSEFS